MSTVTANHDKYMFDNHSEQARTQFAVLAELLDPTTASVLDRLDLQRGNRFLEIGAGGGSITRRLSDITGPDGQVVAADLNPVHLSGMPDNVTVVQHDLRTGPPAGGPFDLIHGRLVLQHLPDRERVLRELVDVLAPGGWMVVGEFTPPRHMTVADSADDDVFRAVSDAFLSVVDGHGASTSWPYRVYGAMLENGLEDVHAVEHSESWVGGDAGCTLLKSNSYQTEAGMLAAGIKPDQLERYRELMDDPKFSAMGWRLVYTTGRKPG